MTSWVSVGRVGRPHGLDGAFVVEAASTDPDRLAVGATVYLGDAPATVVTARRAGGRPVVALDRPAARGDELRVRAEDLPATADGEYYAFELVGLRVEDEDGRALGTVAEVEPGVANDVLRLDSGVALPLVEDWVREVAPGAGTIVVARGLVDPPGPHQVSR